MPIKRIIEGSQAHRKSWGMPVAILIGLLFIGNKMATAPDIEDYIQIESIAVVALDDVVKDAGGNVISGTPRLPAGVGEQLYVMAEAKMLQDASGQYRTSLRNLTEGVNVFGATLWSSPVPYRKGEIYRKYHTIEWWTDRFDITLNAGAYILMTEYKFQAPDGRYANTIQPFVSKEWIVQ